MSPLVKDFIEQWEEQLGKKFMNMRLNSREVVDQKDGVRKLSLVDRKSRNLSFRNASLGRRESAAMQNRFEIIRTQTAGTDNDNSLNSRGAFIDDSI